MPIRVQNDLPVKEILEHENIFVIDASIAYASEALFEPVYRRVCAGSLQKAAQHLAKIPSFYNQGVAFYKYRFKHMTKNEQ